MTNCDKRYFDPLTESGCALPRHSQEFVVHEVGAMRLTDTWNYVGVRSPFWRAYYNPDPGAAVRSEGRTLALSPDRVLLLPSLCLFDCLPKPGVRHLWIHFSVDAPWMPVTSRICLLTAEEIPLWSRLAGDAQLPYEPQRLLHAALACLHLLWSRIPPEETPALSPRMRTWLRFVRTRLDIPPTLDEMAAALAMGRRTFLRWFKTETGKTPQNFTTDLRIREACIRLRYSNDSIEEIAAATGFSDRHHFSRVFKQRSGLPPASFRSGNREPPFPLQTARFRSTSRGKDSCRTL